MVAQQPTAISPIAHIGAVVATADRARPACGDRGPSSRAGGSPPSSRPGSLSWLRRRQGPATYRLIGDHPPFVVVHARPRRSAGPAAPLGQRGHRLDEGQLGVVEQRPARLAVQPQRPRPGRRGCAGPRSAPGPRPGPCSGASAGCWSGPPGHLVQRLDPAPGAGHVGQLVDVVLVVRVDQPLGRQLGDALLEVAGTSSEAGSRGYQHGAPSWGTAPVSASVAAGQKPTRSSRIRPAGRSCRRPGALDPRACRHCTGRHRRRPYHLPGMGSPPAGP